MKFITNHSLIWVIIFITVFSSFSNNVSSNEEYNTTDIENLAYKQELHISIDTSLDESKFKPIDIHIDFNEPCWAKNEMHHSVRVVFDDGSELIEIDSQIYDLEKIDDNHIKSCKIVFLIPENADGNEKYYVLYDTIEKDAPGYKDSIILEDTNYYYEPISGQKIAFDFYKIIEDGYVIYGVIQKGEILGNPVSQHVAKVKPYEKIFETNTIDQLAAFDFRHGVKGEPDFTGPAAATKVYKNVLVDGNLMVRLRIETSSPQGDLKTDNIYTYYYCPTDTKRLFINVNNEVIKTVDIVDPEIFDGNYAGIITIKSRSKTIEKMNVGNLLPSIHLYDEDETIKEYNVPQDPDSVEKEIILSTKDDVDLGNKGWICLDDPSTGKVHGLVLDSTVGISEEDDGVQIKAYVRQNLKLPGLEADTGSVFFGKNTYERGGSHTTVLPQGLQISFKVVFISDEAGGYEIINSESDIIQTLLKNIPIKGDDVSDVEEDSKGFDLTTFVHMSPSIPMGSLLSAALGKNFPYISAELYKENNLKSSGTVGRLPLGRINLDFEGSIVQKIKSAFGIFDWKNTSFFKKIKFPDLEPGKYVIRIYRENRFFGWKRLYIGFAIVNLQSDEKIRIFCRPQGSVKLSIYDQNDVGIENVRFSLISEDVSIIDAVTDKNGSVILNAPCHPLKPYKLRAIYKGFLIKEKEITLGLRNRFLQLKESFLIENHRLNLNIKDTWGFAPDVDITPTLESNEMIANVVLSADKIDDGAYYFEALFPAKYSLNMKYKSFEVNEDVSIDFDQTLDLTFPAEFGINFDVVNSYGYSLTECEIKVSREGKSERNSIDENGLMKIFVPPGKYDISVFNNGGKIAQQEINVRGDREIDILTSQESSVHTIILYLGAILVAFSIIFMLWRRKIYVGMRLLIVALLIISLVSPWWILTGSDGTTQTTTRTLLIPPKIVTLSSSSDALGGDISLLPEEVTMVLSLLSLLIINSGILIFVSIVLKGRYKKTQALLSILCIIFLIVTISIFLYAMSLLTEVGLGSFIGSGDVETSLPGLSESKVLPSQWGPGIGFILGLLSVIILVIPPIYGRLKKK
jgi:hypothetical protein